MFYRLLLVSAITLISLLTFSNTQAAPVTRTVADRFEITVGYLHEPALLGDTNGIRIVITENDKPVTGVSSNLVAQVEFMEAVRVFNIEESAVEPGVYSGIFIPMQPGDYSFRLTGTIDGTEINEHYAVADGLVKVLPRSDFEFPNAAHGFVVTHLAAPAAATAVLGIVALVWRKRTASPNR